MDEIQKTEMRNYVMSAGFFILATMYLIYSFPIDLNAANAMNILTSQFAISNVGAVLLIAIGVILAILKKRDLTAITFFLMGATLLFIGNIWDALAAIVFGFFIILFAVMVLLAKDKKKYMLFIIPAFVGVRAINLHIIPPTLDIILNIVFTVLCLYYAFACASERIALPGRAVLTADVETDFKTSGSVIGYFFFGISSAIWVGVYFLNIPISVGLQIDALAGMMMILSGILLLAIGKMKFTSVMFMLAGLLVFITQFLAGPLTIAFAIMFIVLGLFAILRKESRILPGIMFIIYGLTGLFSVLGSNMATIPVVSIVLNLVVALIAVYIAFAVFTQKKLPLF